jgi:hypothetical protein
MCHQPAEPGDIIRATRQLNFIEKTLDSVGLGNRRWQASCARRQEDHAINPVGMGQGILDGNAATIETCNKNRAVGIKAFKDRIEIPDLSVLLTCRRRLAEAPPVIGDNAKAVSQPAKLRPPHPTITNAGMEKRHQTTLAGNACGNHPTAGPNRNMHQFRRLDAPRAHDGTRPAASA